MTRSGCLLFCLFFLGGCSLFQGTPPVAYDPIRVRHLQKQENWSFDGRLGLVNERDSVSVSISWRHRPDSDDIELAGPLSQGKVAIRLLADRLIIDDGGNRREYLGSVENAVHEQLGVEIPLKALKFWVLGVVDPGNPFVAREDGFIQEGWVVRFKELQWVGSELFPKRMSAEKDKTKVKLVVDQWVLI